MQQSRLDRAKDTGLAILLILFLVEWFSGISTLRFSILVVLLLMVWPKVFAPFSVVWFGSSEFLGKVVSTLILSAIFFLMLTPMGLVRRWFDDPMGRKSFGNGSQSTFKHRDQWFEAKDLEKPF